jgi:hypothetical protein
MLALAATRRAIHAAWKTRVLAGPDDAKTEIRTRAVYVKR